MHQEVHQAMVKLDSHLPQAMAKLVPPPKKKRGRDRQRQGAGVPPPPLHERGKGP